MILFKILLLLSVILFLHSYLFYPLSLYLAQRIQKKKKKKALPFENLPFVSVIISVYNEEFIIEEKIKSIIQGNYPLEKIQIYIGSDASTDDSNVILSKLAALHPQITLNYFSIRRGKTMVVNDLVSKALEKNSRSKDHILLFTDANVILDQNTIYNLIKNFGDEQIGLVDSRIIPKNSQKVGIARAEIKYINLETWVKKWEGDLWGLMMGAFGGCFAIRSSYAVKIPDNLITDDFYISMKVIEQGGQAINEISALCYEGIPNQMEEEFKRKSRISSGNFQSLKHFGHFLLSKPLTRAYVFFSHKVIRWIGPFLILTMLISSVILAIYESGWLQNTIAGFMILVFICIPVLDWILENFRIHSLVFRGIRYFVLMNIALIYGFIKYVRGIRNSVWEPPKRNKV